MAAAGPQAPQSCLLPLPATLQQKLPAATPSYTSTKAVEVADDKRVKSQKSEVALTAAAPVGPAALAGAGGPAAKTAKQAAAVLAPASPGYTTTIKGRTGRYYIMGGAFATRAAAMAQRQGLARLRHRARVLLPGPGETLYKVSIADYPDRATAEAEARRMRTQTRLGTGLWVLQR